MASRSVSMGIITGDDTPAVLRGPIVGRYLRMLIGGVQWGHLDYLILDLPLGTGDTQLTLSQSLTLSGAVIITTPQDVRSREQKTASRSATEKLEIAQRVRMTWYCYLESPLGIRKPPAFRRPESP